MDKNIKKIDTYRFGTTEFKTIKDNIDKEGNRKMSWGNAYVIIPEDHELHGKKTHEVKEYFKQTNLRISFANKGEHVTRMHQIDDENDLDKWIIGLNGFQQSKPYEFATKPQVLTSAFDLAQIVNSNELRYSIEAKEAKFYSSENGLNTIKSYALFDRENVLSEDMKHPYANLSESPTQQVENLIRKADQKKPEDFYIENNLNPRFSKINNVESQLHYVKSERPSFILKKDIAQKEIESKNFAATRNLRIQKNQKGDYSYAYSPSGRKGDVITGSDSSLDKVYEKLTEVYKERTQQEQQSKYLKFYLDHKEKYYDNITDDKLMLRQDDVTKRFFARANMFANRVENTETHEVLKGIDTVTVLEKAKEYGARYASPKDLLEKAEQQYNELLDPISNQQEKDEFLYNLEVDSRLHQYYDPEDNTTSLSYVASTGKRYHEVIEGQAVGEESLLHVYLSEISEYETSREKNPELTQQQFKEAFENTISHNYDTDVRKAIQFWENNYEHIPDVIEATKFMPIEELNEREDDLAIIYNQMIKHSAYQKQFEEQNKIERPYSNFVDFHKDRVLYLTTRDLAEEFLKEKKLMTNEIGRGGETVSEEQHKSMRLDFSDTSIKEAEERAKNAQIDKVLDSVVQRLAGMNKTDTKNVIEELRSDINEQIRNNQNTEIDAKTFADMLDKSTKKKKGIGM